MVVRMVVKVVVKFLDVQSQRWLIAQTPVCSHKLGTTGIRADLWALTFGSLRV